MNPQRNWFLTLSFALCLGLGVALLLLSSAGAQAPAATTRYVAPTGADGGACTDPGAPCRTVQYAVDAAGDGDEVLVATGVYTGVEARMGITQVVYISKTLSVRGGYRADFGARDPDAYPTTLDAEGAGRVIYASGPGITLTLEGLRLTGGTAIGSNEGGGGLYATEATAFVRDSAVYSNTAEAYGGGVYLWICNATLEANTVQSNTVLAPSYYHGGGALYASSSELALTDNDVRNNTSGERAGGVYLGGGNATLVGNTFAGNVGIGREGGAFHLRNGKATLSENVFRDNQAYWGGGVYADMGTLTLTHNVFISNSVVVYSGGAVSLLESVGTLRHNTIMSNTADSRGGGVHAYNQYNPDAQVTLDGNLITSNHAKNDGGGVFVMGNLTATLTNNVIADNRADGQGDGMSSWGAAAYLLHNTLARNDGTGLRVEAGPVHLTNTLLYSHTVGVQNAGGAVTMTQTLWDSVLTPTLGVVAETGSFTGTAALAADGYHLTQASDAVDAGLFAGVGHDVDGERRPMGGGPDVGADEYPATQAVYLPLVWKAPGDEPGTGPTPPAH